MHAGPLHNGVITTRGLHLTHPCLPSASEAIGLWTFKSTRNSPVPPSQKALGALQGHLHPRHPTRSIQRGRARNPLAAEPGAEDGDVIEPQKRCEECEDRPAAFACATRTRS